MAGESADESSPGFAHRLVRTLSGRAISKPARPPGTAPNALPEVDEGATANMALESESKQKGLLTGIIDRFKDLGLSLGIPSGSDGRATGSYTDIANNNEATSPSETPHNAGSDQAESHQDGVVQSEADPAEPLTLAERIRSMIEALPLPTSPRSPTSKKPKPPKHDASGRPIPPPGATPIKDSKLIAMLSSPTIMNGGRQGERERRISVFSVLDSLGSIRPDGDDDDVEDGGNETERGGDEADDGGAVFHDTSGIMMYSPLIPTSDSLVEIAESGIVSPAVEPVDVSSEAAQLAGWMGMWPFSALGGGIAQTSRVPPSSPALSNATLLISPPGSPRSIRTRAQRVWVPSTTKLSFQAMWWGYKIYLPPPVMDILDDKQIEAAKRAALITTALTWFFSNIPLTSLPPAVRPPLLLLQTLVPYLGYIGTFISWSWGTVKSYDTGYGVIMTATWLLPIALIPGSWGEDDFPPPSPPEQVPTPLPPSEGPTQPPGSPPPANPPASPPSSPTNPPDSSPPATTPPFPSPAPAPPSDPPLSPPISPPPASPSSPSPVPPDKLPIQKPIGTPSNTAPPPASEPDVQTPQVLSPLSVLSPLQQPSEPLPSWVHPPPPPSPPKIPLPELEDETPASPSPKFGGLGVLQMRRGKDKSKSRDKDKDRDNERKKEKTKMKFKAMVSSPFSSSSKKGIEG